MRSVVIKEGWFYLGTFLGGEHGDVSLPPEQRSPKCTLFIRHAQLRRGPSGKVRSVVETDACEFADEPAMLAWIEEHDAAELPEEADGNPHYVPEGYWPDDVKAMALDAEEGT